MKNFILAFLLLGMPMVCFADGEENGDENSTPTINWPAVLFTSSADGTDKNILPGTEVTVEVKLDTEATGYKWEWENGSNSVYRFISGANPDLDKAQEKKIMITLTDSVGNSKKDSVIFYIWPKPNVNGDAKIGLVDKDNTRNDEVKYIRGGNRISLQQPEVHGGYGKGWRYSWSINGVPISDTNPTIPNNLTYTDGITETSIACVIQNACRDSIWFPDTTIIRPITIFQMPALPSSFIRKGDGTTGTWIVKGYQRQMGSLKIALRNENSVEDVFEIGNNDIVQANEDYWWFHSADSIKQKELDVNKLCIYTERNYGDSIKITSQLLMLGDETYTYWDGSVFSIAKLEPVENDETPDGEEGEDKSTEQPDGTGESRIVASFSISGGQTNKPQSGLNIVRMKDGTVRKLIIR